MEEETKVIQPKCSHCMSKFGYMKIKERIWQCRICGLETKLEDEKDEEE